MMLLTYIGTTGATVTYSLDNADKTEAVAATDTGVTALKVGTNNTVYGVVVASPPVGGTVHWYEGGDYQASESLAEAVVLAADQPHYAPTTWRDLEAIGTPLQADDYTAPDNAGIAAAKAAAQSADGKLTSERLALIDGVAQEATVEGVPGEVDATLSVSHGSGSWESPVPMSGALVTPESIGDDGLPLGRIMPYGTISVYLDDKLHYRLDEIADADGDFVLTLPYGSTWTLVAENPPNYRATTATITIPTQT